MEAGSGGCGAGDGGGQCDWRGGLRVEMMIHRCGGVSSRAQGWGIGDAQQDPRSGARCNLYGLFNEMVEHLQKMD